MELGELAAFEEVGWKSGSWEIVEPNPTVCISRGGVRLDKLPNEKRGDGWIVGDPVPSEDWYFSRKDPKKGPIWGSYSLELRLDLMHRDVRASIKLTEVG